MNKNILFLPLISCALLTSCAGEDANKTIEPPQQAEGRSITFEVEPLGVETKSTSTKVSVRPTDASDGLEWTNNEEVSFLFYESEANQFESTFTVKKDLMGNVSMTGSRPATAGNYHVIAMSPKGDYFKDASFESTLSIPQTQTQTGSNYSHLTDYVYLYSHPTTKLAVDASGNTSGEFPLQFNPLNSLVRFDIVNESSKKVTLNSITIKLSGGGVLYTTATVQEGLGELTYSGAVDDMTLELSNASIEGGIATPFVAYMAAWSSNNSGNLEINLNITPDGETARDITYDLNNVLFESGLRTHIGLNIEADDVTQNVYDNLGEEVINSLTYKTYTYTPPSGLTITWMMTNYNYLNNYDGYNGYVNSCPADWSAPTTTNIDALLNHMTSFPAATSLFKDALIGPSYYRASGTAVSSNFAPIIDDVLIFVSGSNRSYYQPSICGPFSAQYTYYGTINTISNSIAYSSEQIYVNDNSGYICTMGPRYEARIFPIRCVKYN